MWILRIDNVHHIKTPQRQPNQQQTIHWPIWSIQWVPALTFYTMKIANDHQQAVSFQRIFSLHHLINLFWWLTHVDDPDGNQAPNHSVFSIEYYQKFFNVDAQVVWDRIVSAIVPRRAPINYLKNQIDANPDLYGPFWIVVTLVKVKFIFTWVLSGIILHYQRILQIFSIAISGNIASYLQAADTKFHWRYNFHLVSFAATTIIMYVCLIPFALWAALKWSARPSDSELITEEVIDSYTHFYLEICFSEMFSF